MEIKKDKVVSLVYELRSNGKEGEVIESLTDANPLTFLFGHGNLLPRFEDNISGLKVGDKFAFELPCKDAYGEVDYNAIVDVPTGAFSQDGKINEDMMQVGNSVPMMDRDGNRFNGIILEVTDENVKMDFNHPLAGDDLFFNGYVTDVREATDEEISHGHIHGGAGCGSGSCGDEHEQGGCGSCGCH